MKTYLINVAPSAGTGIGFTTVGDNERHALAGLSLSQRLVNSNIQHSYSRRAPMERDIFERENKRNMEVLRTIRKPGRFAFQRTTSIGPNSWLRLQ
jgi:hypothetical protein